MTEVDDLLQQAAQFYGPSIDFSLVKVKTTSVSGGGRAWTADNTIRFARGRGDLKMFIHELAHVWQYQNGNRQLVRGLAEQVGSLLGKDPYDYGGGAGIEAAAGAGVGLSSFSNESQAQIIEDYWHSQHGGLTGYHGETFTSDYVDGLQSLVLRSGIGTAPPTGANPVESAIGRIVNGTLGLFRQ
jgi:hypothetical protein